MTSNHHYDIHPHPPGHALRIDRGGGGSKWTGWHALSARVHPGLGLVFRGSLIADPRQNGAGSVHDLAIPIQAVMAVESVTVTAEVEARLREGGRAGSR